MRWMEMCRADSPTVLKDALGRFANAMTAKGRSRVIRYTNR